MAEKERVLEAPSDLICLPRISIKTYQLFEKLTELFRRFIDFDDSLFYILAVVYVLLTYFYDIFDQVPYIQVFGLKGSGKSLLGELFEGLCFSPFNSSEISDASLYRAIDQEYGGMTMIIDEADDLGGPTRRGILLRVLRSGYRRHGNVTRCGPNGTVQRFSTFCPKIIINERGIHDSALDTRTIPVHMIRSARSLEKFLSAKIGKEFKEVKDVIRSFSEDYRDLVSDRYISFKCVDGISGRDEEIWTPIFIIAEILDAGLAEPHVKQDMHKLAIKIIFQRRIKQLVENKDAQILESTCAYVGQVKPLDPHGLYVAEELWRFIKERCSLPDLKLETVSRILNRYNIIKGVKRLRLGKEIRDREIEVQRSCYLIDREKLASLTEEYQGGEIL